MDKETLSMSQASKIIDTANDILGRSNGKMNDSFNQFLVDLSNVWEDKNAVELAKVVNGSYQNILENLTKNNQVFADTIISIAKSYKQVGGMQEAISAGACGFGGQLDMGQVHEYFPDGNGDDFGFRNITVSPVQVMDALKTLESDIKTIAVEIVDAIKTIPAFGNSNVKLEIAKSAGKIVEIVDGALTRVRKSTEEQVINTAKAYGAAGEAAIALVGGISSDIKDVIEMPQVKYAPPPMHPQVPETPINTVPVHVPPVQMKYAPPPVQPPIESVHVPPVQMKYAPPPVQPPIHVPLPETPQVKYAPPGSFGISEGKTKGK